jgi:hypothetical protein
LSETGMPLSVVSVGRLATDCSWVVRKARSRQRDRSAAASLLLSQRSLLTELRLRETGRERKSMQSLCNDFGSIAVIAPVLRQSPGTESHSAGPGQSRGCKDSAPHDRAEHGEGQPYLPEDIVDGVARPCVTNFVLYRGDGMQHKAVGDVFGQRPWRPSCQATIALPDTRTSFRATQCASRPTAELELLPD